MGCCLGGLDDECVWFLGWVGLGVWGLVVGFWGEAVGLGWVVYWMMYVGFVLWVGVLVWGFRWWVCGAGFGFVVWVLGLVGLVFVVGLMVCFVLGVMFC